MPILSIVELSNNLLGMVGLILSVKPLRPPPLISDIVIVDFSGPFSDIFRKSRMDCVSIRRSLRVDLFSESKF